MALMNQWRLVTSDGEAQMKRSITFIVPGEPQGKQRARVVFAGGRARAFTPDKTVSYQDRVRAAFFRAVDLSGEKWKPADCAAVDITAYYGVPASWSKRKQLQAIDGEIYPRRKPDLDNVAKAVLDALNGFAYTDDACVIAISMWKRFGDPGVRVSITRNNDVLERHLGKGYSVSQ